MKGENLPAAEVPESFKVLVKEMQSLCLNVELEGVNRGAAEVDEEADEGETLLGALQADAAKTEAEDADAITSIAAELTELLGEDLSTDLLGGTDELIGGPAKPTEGGDAVNDLIGAGEEE